jgi:two-component system, LytTR family, response regulator LytT
MQKVKILIVEDELIIAEDIRMQLIHFGYEVTGVAINYNQALNAIMENMPDMVLVDIGIEGNKDGIELGAFLKSDADIPFIYLTSNAEKAVIDRAKTTFPNAYLLKPFKAQALYAAIEIALANGHGTPDIDDTTNSTLGELQYYVLKDSIFVKKDNTFYKVKFADILFIRVTDNQLNLFIADNQVLNIDSPLAPLAGLLTESWFCQTHPAYIVNLNHLDEFNDNRIKIRNEFLLKLKAL